LTIHALTHRLDPEVAGTSFSGLFDNAAAFPPAAMPMEGAVALHSAAAHAGHAWATRRLLVPLGQEADAVVALSLIGAGADSAISVSLVSGPGAAPGANLRDGVAGALGKVAIGPSAWLWGMWH
jgi:hypothetical protein